MNLQSYELTGSKVVIIYYATHVTYDLHLSFYSIIKAHSNYSSLQDDSNLSLCQQLLRKSSYGCLRNYLESFLDILCLDCSLT